MAYPTFAPPYPPVTAAEDQLQARRIGASFGDGYAQNTLDGLNVEQSNVQLTFEPLTPAQYLTLEAFLEANSGLPFNYALPTDNVVRLWTATSWTPTRQGTFYVLQISLAQGFQLGGGLSMNYSQATNASYIPFI